MTRFLPSTLRSKRHDDKVKQPLSHHLHTMHQHQPHAMMQKPGQRQFPDLANKHPTHIEPAKAATKDDAYMQFMREMQGLL